jgi:hypothetical protein
MLQAKVGAEVEEAVLRAFIEDRRCLQWQAEAVEVQDKDLPPV